MIELILICIKGPMSVWKFYSWK